MMIVPLTSLQLRLIQLLKDRDETPALLERLRNVLLTMYLSGEVTEDLFDQLMSDLQTRCQNDPKLAALHGDTAALNAKAMNSSTKKP